MVDTDKVKSPFSRQQRNQLLAWSKFAKELDVLNGYQRKVIYEGGHYNYVFISRLNQITDALRSLRDHLEDDEDDLADEILCCSYVCFGSEGRGRKHRSPILFGRWFYGGFIDLKKMSHGLQP